MSDSASPWTVAYQAPIHRILLASILEWVAIPFSRAYSSGIEPGTEPRSLALRADSLPSEPPGKLGKLLSLGPSDPITKAVAF